MERQEYTTQQHTTQQGTPQNSRWRRIRVFDRPQSQDSASPSVAFTVLVLLGIIALIAIGIMVF
jgi:hypothetical protein